jgi:biotin carboxyl carrier protein
MDYLVKIEGKEFIVTIDSATHPPQIKVNGKPIKTRFSTRSDNSHIQLLMDNRSYDVEVVKQQSSQNGDFSVFIYGREFSLYAEDERLAKIREVAGMGAGGDTQKEVRAPMPGLVTRILKNPGDQVRRGESLILVEAMKMENELKSLVDGTIKEIKVKEGQSIDKNTLLVLLE